MFSKQIALTIGEARIKNQVGPGSWTRGTAAAYELKLNTCMMTIILIIIIWDRRKELVGQVSDPWK